MEHTANAGAVEAYFNVRDIPAAIKAAASGGAGTSAGEAGEMCWNNALPQLVTAKKPENCQQTFSFT